MALSMDQWWVNMSRRELTGAMKELSRGLVWLQKRASTNVQFIKRSPASRLKLTCRCLDLCGFRETLDDYERDVVRSRCSLTKLCECRFDAIADAAG